MNLRKVIVSGLGTGYLPASGTWGSLGPCLVFLAIAYGMGGALPTARLGAWPTNLAMLVLLVASSVACVKLGAFAEQAYGTKDPGECTIDEWAGQALTLLFLPLSAGSGYWLTVAAAFAAFRFFDILKPPPVRAMEKYPLGWGVLLDDLLAGVYANIACQLILRLGFHL